MLDTNMASYVISDHDGTLNSVLEKVSLSQVCISVITEAEILFGVQKKSSSENLKRRVEGFFGSVASLPWGSEEAQRYAELRFHSQAKGITLANMDLLIAAHSIAVGATLVTNDKAFSHFSEWLRLENWISK